MHSIGLTNALAFISLGNTPWKHHQSCLVPEPYKTFDRVSSALFKPSLSLRNASQHNRLALALEDQNDDKTDHFIKKKPNKDFLSHSHKEVQASLNHCGFALLPTQVPKTITQYQADWINMFRDNLQTRAGSAQAFKRIELRWQKLLSNEKHSTQPLKEKTQWNLVSNKNCRAAGFEKYTHQHPYFQSADTFFNQLHAVFLPLFAEKSMQVLVEVRYIDPLQSRPTQDTHWHHDQEPVCLTATCSWMGPGTIFSPHCDLLKTQPSQNVGLKQLNEVALHHVPEGATLAFYGKKAARSPLWHKSPATTAPRLLLIYRLIDAKEPIAIISPPD